MGRWYSSWKIFYLRVVTGSGAVRWIGQAPVTLQVDI